MASTSELSIVSRMAGSGLPRRTAVKVGTGAIATTLILAWLRMSKARRFDCQRSARSPSPLKRKNPENRYEALHEPRQAVPIRHLESQEASARARSHTRFCGILEPRQERRTIWGISRHMRRRLLLTAGSRVAPCGPLVHRRD